MVGWYLGTPGGGGLLDVLTGASVVETNTNAYSTVTPESLAEAIGLMVAGHSEFLILGYDDGQVNRFVQAAGEGEGPYQLQYNPGDADQMVEVPGGVDRRTMDAVFHRLYGGDPAWHAGLAWQPLGPIDPAALRRRAKEERKARKARERGGG